jgi:hypothetical protein
MISTVEVKPNRYWRDSVGRWLGGWCRTIRRSHWTSESDDDEDSADHGIRSLDGLHCLLLGLVTMIMSSPYFSI